MHGHTCSKPPIPSTCERACSSARCTASKGEEKLKGDKARLQGTAPGDSGRVSKGPHKKKNYSFQYLANDEAAARTENRNQQVEKAMNEEAKVTALRKMTYGMWVLTAGNGDDLEGSSVTWV